MCVYIYIYAYTYTQLLYLAALTSSSAARSLVSAVFTLDTTRDVSDWTAADASITWAGKGWG